MCQSQSPSSSHPTPWFVSLVSIYFFSTSVSLFCKDDHLYKFPFKEININAPILLILTVWSIENESNIPYIKKRFPFRL